MSVTQERIAQLEALRDSEAQSSKPQS